MMAESLFIQEVRHRGVLLTGSFRPGKAIKWVREKNNHQRLLCLQEETRKYLSGGHTAQEVSEFWHRQDTSADIKEFINCLESGAQVLRQRGKKGDIYSIAVLHYLVSHFIQHYLQCTPEIKSASTKKG
ncbi:hypothetical protein [Salmonella enterica]|uniref:hypothetical protein n=1 Tax=Salmonella enterica TaxID=28901 RepID=UPI00157D0A5A|nr:hypothetical protein [Salmonella enterica]